MKQWLLLAAGAAAAIGAHFLPAPPGTELLIQIVGILMTARSKAIVEPER